MASFELKVNGAVQRVEAPADMPLLWVLRDLLGLTGTKFGCGIAECRSCVVLLEGMETFACQTPVSAAVGREITTIEGLAGGGDKPALHALQAAWLEQDVTQCGYCQPGQLLTAYALLQRTPNPSDEEIDAIMSGVICRCGTYSRIRRAIHRAAELMSGGASK
jgi:isoquinoline 1-oxidoreductase alpha subunit